MIDSKNTKIICTIGPSSWDPEILEQLIIEGMNLARLNFSHGTHQEKLQQIKNIKAISKKLNKSIGIIADLAGPKLRLGIFSENLLSLHAHKLPDGKQEVGRNPIIILEKDETVQLSISPIESELPIQFDLSVYLKKGQKILLNDGLVELKVLGIKGKVITAIVQNYGYISSNKGVNVPETDLAQTSLTEKDIEDAHFALQNGVDFLALSFVQSAEDLKAARQLIAKHKSKAKIIVKLEKPKAVDNLDKILKATDAVMIARGDLAIEIKAAEVPIVQQEIIRLARQYQKPVIVATQMLESMVENPRPTRAEVSDVANAVLNEVDAVMLSAESANGKYPVEAVKIMKQVIHSVESNPEYKRYIKINWEHMDLENLSLNAIVSSAASLAFHLNARIIAVATASGRTAQLISSFRPTSSILAITHTEEVRNQLTLVWGIKSILVESCDSQDGFCAKIIKKIKDLKLVEKGDKIVLVAGTKVGESGDTNTIKVVKF